MTILLANWELILFLILLLFFLIIKVKQLLSVPSEKRQELILLWLVEAVTIAEKQYGGKTGGVKRSLVYEMFIKRFGFIATFVSKEVFEGLVDKALRIMEETFNNELNKKQSE